MSLQIRTIFAEYTRLIEPLSLDEAYLDVTENLQGIASAMEIAQRIKAKIRTQTQLTASAGISYNKFLAKPATDHRKPMVFSSSHLQWDRASSKRCRWNGFMASDPRRPQR